MMQLSAMKKWIATGLVSSGLLVAGWLYAADSTNFCANYSGSGEGGSCCDTSVSALCQLDTDVNNGFSQLYTALSGYFATTQTFISGFLQTLIKLASGSGAYIDNDQMNSNASRATTNALKVEMQMDTGQQLEVTKKIAAKMPGIAEQFDVNQFSITALTNNPGIEANDKAKIQEIIALLGGSGSSIKNIEAALALKSNNRNIQEFLAGLGAYYTIKSNAMNVLQSTLESRSVVNGLNSTVGVDQPISPTQMDMNTVNKILSFPSDSAFNTISVQDVLKASYSAQAQMLYELFKLRQSIEQLNVSMAVIQLQMLNSLDKNSLEALRQKATS